VLRRENKEMPEMKNNGRATGPADAASLLDIRDASGHSGCQPARLSAQTTGMTSSRDQIAAPKKDEKAPGGCPWSFKLFQ